MTARTCFVDSVCWIALLNRADRLHAHANTVDVFRNKRYRVNGRRILRQICIRDPYFGKRLVYQQRLAAGDQLVTTTAVLNETANALSAPRFRLAIIALHQRLQRSQQVSIIFVDQELWENGWQLFAARLDKEWSLTDCISMIVCQAQPITDVLTTDHHFKQAGFTNLLTLP